MRHIVPLTCSAFGHRDVCLLSSRMELDGIVVVFKVHKKHLTITAMSRNHDPLTQDSPQTLSLAVSCIGTIFFHSNYTHSSWHRGGHIAAQPTMPVMLFCTHVVYTNHFSIRSPLMFTSSAVTSTSLSTMSRCTLPHNKVCGLF